MPVRVKFTKVGMLQYISHLDLNRTMKTVMVRAALPIRYTEGYNPHAKMAFALPLSIGAESVCELLDFKLDEEMPYDEVKRRLNDALPPEMRVLEAYEPKEKFTEIHFAEYDICTPEPFLTDALDKDSIVVMKRTKSGTKQSDIKPLIRSWKAIDGGIRCVLAADPQSYLNPEYIATVLSLTDYTITRRRMVKADGESEFR